MPDENHYLSKLDNTQLVAAPAFSGEVTTTYLDHPSAGGEYSPSDLDPRQFVAVAPEQARYLGVQITEATLPMPIIFGIRLQGDKEFLLEQADDLASGLLGQVAPMNKTIAVTGLAAAAYMHTYATEMNEIHKRDKGSDHPHIDTRQLGFMTELGQALAQTAQALKEHGEDAAHETWEREYTRIENSTPAAALERNWADKHLPAPQSTIIIPKGRHTPDSDTPPANEPRGL